MYNLCSCCNIIEINISLPLREAAPVGHCFQIIIVFIIIKLKNKIQTDSNLENAEQQQ